MVIRHSPEISERSREDIEKSNGTEHDFWKISHECAACTGDGRRW